MTQVHIGVQDKRGDEQVDECVEWDAAVRVLRTTVGSAWCERVEDVVSCREDVAWRRSVGMQAT